ncbi:hypothetical protein CPB83DRAFT_861203 [Crepidotus variabilis]|uniref:Uncharacterized protein n=1 Tax=Crepidotus variabilis TaxID=179855 RepID=A0A9P6E8M0_9AGAR|nr:hypothetical protein CPB83DRAFT_861203 [Crepidotus variabilis]
MQDSRTISSIVLGCIFTLVPCIWCCVRPDFPSPKDSKLTVLKMRLHVAIWVVIAPELVAYWAFRQWWEAGKIAKEYENRRWTRKNALFLIMGGFMLHDNDRPVQTLSIQHLRRFLRQGAIDFPSISAIDIHQSNKLHPLLYILVCVQTLWFVVQCIARLATGLLVTQLEIFTLTIVLMNGLILIFMWHKPIDVRQPIRLNALNDSYRIPEDRPPVLMSITDDYKREGILTKDLKRIFMEEAHIERRLSPILYRFLGWAFRGVFFSPIDTVFRDFGRLAINMQSSVVKDGALNVPLFYSPDSTDFLQFTFPAAVFLGIVINAVLCLFWSWGYFPSETTRLVWKIGALTSAGFGALSLLFIILITITQLWNQIAFNTVIDLIGDFFIYLGIILFVICYMPFVIARLLLIVESFICLKSLPQSGLTVVPWTRYIPHFS